MVMVVYRIRMFIWGLGQIAALIIGCISLTASAFLAPFSKALHYDVASLIATTLWSYMQWVFETAHHGKITISGDEIPMNESALVISNHLSYSDFYMIHSLAVRRNMIGRCRYFAKDSLKWVPLLGWTLLLINMIMVTRNWMKDKAELFKVFSPIRQHKLPIWLIAYVEGTRFTPAKKAASQEFCASRGKKPLNFVLYPRYKGFYTTVTQFRNTHIKYVYDFTLVYRAKKGQKLQIAPTPFEVHGYNDISAHYDCHVHVRRYAIEDVPNSEAGVTKWLEDRWYEKDAILKGMNEHWTSARGLGKVKVLTDS